MTQKYLFLSDLHYGFERKNGHKVALHDAKAMAVALKFAADFRPDTLILGGDILDCGAISHHNHRKPGRTEGLRLRTDADGCRVDFIQPLNQLGSKNRVYIEGNHEAWLYDLEEDMPGLEGLLTPKALLNLDGWTVVPQGGHYDLGKLTFIHGDQLSGGEHCAKSAVISWERNIRFGHFHTAQVYTKNTPLHHQLAKTGMAVPALCRKDPSYGKGKPNRHVQGFAFGYVFPDGSYSDQLVLITNGKAMINGKLYFA